MASKHETENADGSVGNNIVCNISSNSVKFVISHTLRNLPREEQVTRTVHLDSDGSSHTCTLTYDWKIYLDVVEEDPRPIIARVEVDFGPTFLRQRHYVWNRPRKLRNPIYHQNGEEAGTIWRFFESRQICAGILPLRISIVGMGGTVLKVTYHPDSEPCEGYFVEKSIPIFGAINGSQYLRPVPLPSDRAFSIVQFTDKCFNPLQLALYTQNSTQWERGEEGATNIERFLVAQCEHDANLRNTKMVNTIISIKLFSDTSNEKNLQNMMKLSQNFIKYEDAIDKIIHINRESRTREEEVQFPQNSDLTISSNKCGVDGDTNRKRHDTLASCSNNIIELVKAMNPKKNEKYRLMFVREEKTQMFMAQFFFEALPADVDFTMTLLRFCILFVHNSFRLQKPNPLKANRSLESEIEFLFTMVIRDRFVEESLRVDEGTKNKYDDDSQVLSNLDIEMIELDDISIPDSVLRGATDDDALSDHLDSGDGWLPDRKRILFENESHTIDDYIRKISKRPRPLSPTTSGAIQHDLFDFSIVTNADVVFRSDLQSFTAEKLKTLCKKLCTGISNKKFVRLERLKSYFDARDNELKTYVGKIDHHCNERILGIEFLFKNDTKRDGNKIHVIMKGGRQMTIPRTSVCQSKCNEKEFDTFPQHLSKEEAKFLFENLDHEEMIETELKNYIGKIDELINGVQNNDKSKNNSCRFVLIHDLFCERQHEIQS